MDSKFPAFAIPELSVLIFEIKDLTSLGPRARSFQTLNRSLTDLKRICCMTITAGTATTIATMITTVTENADAVDPAIGKRFEPSRDQTLLSPQSETLFVSRKRLDRGTRHNSDQSESEREAEDRDGARLLFTKNVKSSSHAGRFGSPTAHQHHDFFMMPRLPAARRLQAVKHVNRPERRNHLHRWPVVLVAGSQRHGRQWRPTPNQPDSASFMLR